MGHGRVEQAHEIGYNQSIQVDGRELHVQTEVLGSAELSVRTMVYDGGTARLVERQVYRGDPAALEALRAVVKEQHTRNVDKLVELERGGTH